MKEEMEETMDLMDKAEKHFENKAKQQTRIVATTLIAIIIGSLVMAYLEVNSRYIVITDAIVGNIGLVRLSFNVLFDPVGSKLLGVAGLLVSAGYAYFLWYIITNYVSFN
jgi:hypothetical protein